ncbi:MAG: hypothetical protein HQL72_01510 [Magnetococcales bacterium]|nr:hypothetical protein [Magnetococcales bacterium]
MISLPAIKNMGQEWLARWDNRKGAGGSALPPQADLPWSRWSSPVVLKQLSQQARKLFATLHGLLQEKAASGKRGAADLYNRLARTRSVGQEAIQSRGWQGERKKSHGRWEEKAYHLTLSNIGQLAGGIVQNHTMVPEDRRPFVAEVVQGRALGRYDEGTFKEVRKLFKRDHSTAPTS